MKKNLFIIATALLMSACSLLPEPYKPAVSQGNVLKQTQVDQLQLGMSEAQVNYLLGTPMIKDAFTPNQWRYLFTSQFADKNTKHSEIDELVLTFDQGTLVVIQKP